MTKKEVFVQVLIRRLGKVRDALYIYSFQMMVIVLWYDDAASPR
jgi:hypothetical protein